MGFPPPTMGSVWRRGRPEARKGALSAIAMDMKKASDAPLTPCTDLAAIRPRNSGKRRSMWCGGNRQGEGQTHRRCWTGKRRNCPATVQDRVRALAFVPPSGGARHAAAPVTAPHPQTDHASGHAAAHWLCCCPVRHPVRCFAPGLT